MWLLSIKNQNSGVLDHHFSFYLWNNDEGVNVQPKHEGYPMMIKGLYPMENIWEFQVSVDFWIVKRWNLMQWSKERMDTLKSKAYTEAPESSPRIVIFCQTLELIQHRNELDKWAKLVCLKPFQVMANQLVSSIR